MKNNKILFFYQLGQDLDVLLPGMTYLLNRGHQIKVVVKHGLFKKSPRTKCLNNLNIEVEELPVKYSVFRLIKTLKGCRTIVTATETNVGPHRLAHQMAKVANLLFKKTITLQHGYENIGLTYTDTEYPIQKIKFASKFILTWSNHLQDGISISTKRKCIPAGLPKPADKYENLPLPAKEYVAIFENLHWGRFSKNYQNMFIDLLNTLAVTFPQISFLVKPHHAGKWLTSRYKGDMPKHENLIILDPNSAQWEPYTAPSVIACSTKIISTPSSVCVDAIILGKPVAVLEFDLNLANYSFATKSKSIDEVIDFLKDIKIKPKEVDFLSHENFLKTLEGLVLGTELSTKAKSQ